MMNATNNTADTAAENLVSSPTTRQTPITTSSTGNR